ncbi:hypothetical protein P171DRAFT_449470 [Karstenula rhodostoma CBS 690.94]|uniref:Uncharacterized protein n=1 Tax=Karstenula rhodostoma CBS 690.94 TaxID=1392251 RepID=A0A9P4U607_9PLEO|nr:hypothetical protein P171DRAFT_449470 [Karstenula rhodostoma CBS 690.94]
MAPQSSSTNQDAGSSEHSDAGPSADSDDITMSGGLTFSFSELDQMFPLPAPLFEPFAAADPGPPASPGPPPPEFRPENILRVAERLMNDPFATVEESLTREPSEEPLADFDPDEDTGMDAEIEDDPEMWDDKDAEGESDDDDAESESDDEDAEGELDDSLSVGEAAGSMRDGESSVKRGKRPRSSSSSEEPDDENTPILAGIRPNMVAIKAELIDMNNINIGGVICNTIPYWCRSARTQVHVVRYERDELEEADWICRNCAKENRLFVNRKEETNLTTYEQSIVSQTGCRIAHCKHPQCRMLINVENRFECEIVYNPRIRNKHVVMSYPVAKQGQLAMAWICGCSTTQSGKNAVIYRPHEKICGLPNCRRPRRQPGNYPILAPRQGENSKINRVKG